MAQAGITALGAEYRLNFLLNKPVISGVVAEAISPISACQKIFWDFFPKNKKKLG